MMIMELCLKDETEIKERKAKIKKILEEQSINTIKTNMDNV